MLALVVIIIEMKILVVNMILVDLTTMTKASFSVFIMNQESHPTLELLGEKGGDAMSDAVDLTKDRFGHLPWGCV